MKDLNELRFLLHKHTLHILCDPRETPCDRVAERRGRITGERCSDILVRHSPQTTRARILHIRGPASYHPLTCIFKSHASTGRASQEHSYRFQTARYHDFISNRSSAAGRTAITYLSCRQECAHHWRYVLRVMSIRYLTLQVPVVLAKQWHSSSWKPVQW